AGIRRDDRYLRRHGLEDRQRQPFVVRRRREDIERSHHGCDAFAPPEPCDVSADAEPLDLTIETAAVIGRSVADDHALLHGYVPQKVGNPPIRLLNSLLRKHAADGAHERSTPVETERRPGGGAGVATSRGKFTDVDEVVNDVEPLPRYEVPALLEAPDGV